MCWSVSVDTFVSNTQHKHEHTCTYSAYYYDIKKAVIININSSQSLPFALNHLCLLLWERRMSGRRRGGQGEGKDRKERNPLTPHNPYNIRENYQRKGSGDGATHSTKVVTSTVVY